jgi:hypothetical protein
MRALTFESNIARVQMTIGQGQSKQWVKRGKGIGETINRLCHRCNNGWMAELEERAKPFILAMVRGIAVSLHSDAQAVVSSWITKTVMVCEFLAPESAWYSDGQRHTFMTSLNPPSGTAIWLGRCSQTGWSSTLTRTLRFGPESPFIDGAVATFAIDHLVFQLLTVNPNDVERNRGNVTYKTDMPDPWARRMFQCWPLQAGAVIWPPECAAATDEDEVHRLARRFEASPSSTPR